MLIYLGWIITIVLLIIFIPKNRIREACIPFLFKQVITWLFGMIVVELRLLEYPVRFFSYANKTSFSFEYFIYPSLCAIFNLHYPYNKSFFGKFMHYIYYCTGLTIIEIIVEKNTNIVKYINWTWYTTWITFFITFFISQKFFVWFFKGYELKN